MTSRNAVYPGIEAPASSWYDLTTTNVDFDLSTVTAARLNIIFQNETTAVWTCSFAPIAGVPAAEGVRVTRLHSADDLPEGSEGFIRVQAECDLSGGGKARGEWVTIPVERAGT